MILPSASKPRMVVTTSWDDGHPLDMRLAEVLSRRGIRGTVYVPGHYGGAPLVDRLQMRDLMAMGFEIGAHTMNHINVAKASPQVALEDMVSGRVWLEDQVGQPITSFCYPGGKFNARAKDLARQAGFRLARTTMAFHCGGSFDPFAMPVSFQLYPHTWEIHLRHAIREGNISGLMSWIRRGMPCSTTNLMTSMVAQAERKVGIFHVWGHSWEIEECGLWSLVEDFLTQVSGRPDVQYLTNGQTLDAVVAKTLGE